VSFRRQRPAVDLISQIRTQPVVELIYQLNATLFLLAARAIDHTNDYYLAAGRDNPNPIPSFPIPHPPYLSQTQQKKKEEEEEKTTKTKSKPNRTKLSLIIEVNLAELRLIVRLFNYRMF